MIDYDFNHNCCGCSACIDACPKHCIKQTTNKFGFVVPDVDKSICVDCHICEKVCPILKPERIEYQDRKMFSAVNKNEELRTAGSSGSIFYLLAEKIISSGGIVFGAAFDDRLQLRHTSAESIEELRPLLKSKYIQSNMQGVYNKVKEQLNTGRNVLFVGTPCQCNALYKFLGSNKFENLLMADFICHGVPSQELFNKSIALWEKKHNCKIEQFEFRHKRPDSVHYFYLKAKGMNTVANYFEITGKYNKFPYYNGFKQYICFRESCYHCLFAVKERVADLTLADFWHIYDIDKNVRMEEFNKGYSMIIVNSNEGQRTLDSILDHVQSTEFSVNLAVECNHSYTKSAPETIYCKSFRWAYVNLPYPLVEAFYFSKMANYCDRIVLRIKGILSKKISVE